MMSPISCMCPSKLRSSNKVMTLAVWFIRSIESSIDVIRSLMSPRSRGVMNVFRSAVITSRVISSASFSRCVISWQQRSTSSSPLSNALSARAAASVIRAWRVKRSKNRSSFGIKARNQPSMTASLEAKAPRERMRPRPTSGPNGPLLKPTMRSGLWFQQLPKTEVVALELGIPHFAVAAEVDAIKASAETLDVAVCERRGKLCEHRSAQLEPFVGEVAAVMVVVNHHQRPRPGDEVAAGERGQPPRFHRLERLGRGVDAAEPRVHAGLAAALFPSRHRAERHQIVARPDELDIGIAPVERLGLLGGVLARPRRVNLLLENNHRRFGDRAAHALIAIDR